MRLFSRILTPMNETPPLAFFITFRTYGTWLHGDSRGSTSRFRNKYRTRHLGENAGWHEENRKRLKQKPFRLNANARSAVRKSILETSEYRKWKLHAQNVRTNHVHIVAGTGTHDGKKVRAAYKANPTRALRESKEWTRECSPWAGKGSVKSIWDLNGLCAVVDYVLFQQGEDI